MQREYVLSQANEAKVVVVGKTELYQALYVDKEEDLSTIRLEKGVVEMGEMVPRFSLTMRLEDIEP